jgi:glycosyltransferase involved in cell wall biosynthesis
MTTTAKPKILIICDYYLPGYISGGGLRSIVNLVEHLGEKFDFWIITRDHDGDEIPYKDINYDEWNLLGTAKVLYLTKDNVKISKLRELFVDVKPQAIYINSVFSKLSINILLLKQLNFFQDTNVILAPEGELSKGALRLKVKKKKLFLKVAKSIGLFRQIIWKATSELEMNEIEPMKGRGSEIFIAPNMPPRHFFEDYKQELKLPKKVGSAKMVFLSRYMKKKNFKWLLENLSGIEGNLDIDIYGPLEDEIYWKQSLRLIEKLPPNIQVKYQGILSNDMVVKTLFNYHFFILPTLGENFGHVFLEALAAGCPLIISDRTPWNNLQKKQVGWDLPLEKPGEWIAKINYCIKLDNVHYIEISSNARNFSDQWLSNRKVEEENLKVLNFSISNTLNKQR